MEYRSLRVGSFEVNCSIVTIGTQTWVIDPGQDAERIMEELRTCNHGPEAVLLTHAHFDHIGAIPLLQHYFPMLKIFVHPKDVPAFSHPMNQCPPDYEIIPLPANIHNCRELNDVTVIETPGHTPGGVCYYFPKESVLFSGDTLFCGSVGRTDFPGGGGDIDALMKSLGLLKQLPDDTIVVPGHGPTTTIGAEKANNPFLR